MYGDTEVIRSRVHQLREQSQSIRQTADQLVTRADAIAWTGRAAEAMRARMRERATALRASATRTEAAGDALESHLHAVVELSDAIAERERAALRLADSGELDPAVLPPAGHRDWLEVHLGREEQA